MISSPPPRSGERIVVAGGSGFVGSHVVAKLCAAGHDVVVLTRRRERARHLLLLPTARVVEVDPYDPAALARWTRHATVAINLAGVLHQRGAPRSSACTWSSRERSLRRAVPAA